MDNSFIIRSLTGGDVPDILVAFRQAFSDYVISVNLTHDLFKKRFIDKLQINFELSAGVFSRGELVGFIFTSVHLFQGKLTAYNGGTGVIPKFRGHRLTQRMYDFLRPKFQKANVEQCLLEVITVNKPAYHVYQKMGFKKTRLLRCFKLFDPLSYKFNPQIDLIKKDKPNWPVYDYFMEIEPSFIDQKELISRNMKNERVTEAYLDNQCVGYIIFQPEFGRISQLGVHPDFRKQNIGSTLLKSVYNDSKYKNLTVLNIDDQSSSTIRFFKENGFTNEMNQHEMILEI